MKPRVVHCKKEPFDVYIGRGVWNGEKSKWGNPFSHKEGTLAEFQVSSRKEAIQRNFELAKTYAYNNDQLFEKFYKQLI